MSDIEKMGTHEKTYGGSAYGCYTIVSVQGASHVKNQQPCQDAFHCSEQKEPSDPVIIAIADGHGDQRHDMSHYGAKLATETAVRVLEDLYKELKTSKTYLFRSFRDDFLKEVLKQWKKEVLVHAAEHDIKGEEPSHVYRRYGTTLLVALLCEDEALIGQIGDGDILLIDGDNRLITPIAKDDLIGNATYSLCSAEASHFWNAVRIPNPVNNQFLMMSTDGLSNCFADDDNFHKFALSLAEYVSSHDDASIGDTLAALLFDYSSKGSGDDITLALFKFKNSPFLSGQKEEQPSTMERNRSTSALPTDEKQNGASSSANIDDPLHIGPSLEQKYRKIGKHIYKSVTSTDQKGQGPRYNIRFKDELQ
ncbi:PP2C family serine/threonine-protein phosphatase [Geobacillus stearothermophilus]|uniref:PP2C family serine/threonine-protein phosphatase n=1 Tax=Geobacillus stearothermophilus TaxID=1422 RepID=UPI002E221BE0|nr:PP2C family serine/threonine-protein phosphatase [Geobacillus stearothermophilus]